MILGTGIDIIEIERIQKAIDRWGDHFLQHVFTDAEIKYSQKHKNATQHFAARFAAKEAVFKAMDTNAPIDWKDIQILNDANGKPHCTYNDENFKHQIFISISHTKNYAVANAIVTD